MMTLQSQPIAVLGVETSCDETAAAVVEVTFHDDAPSFAIHSNIVASQIDVHKEFGGVVPTLAAREHVANLPVVIRSALSDAGKDASDIQLLAVTAGPGLMPCLLTGVHFARTLAWKWGIPVVGVDHMEGHLYSAMMTRDGAARHDAPRMTAGIFPAVTLIVSGGHTILVLVESIGNHRILGETADDAAGEAFDKVARLLGLGYPGGPAIQTASEQGDPAAIAFPRPMANSGDYRFSFSGLKTAVRYALPSTTNAENVAASFQEAVVDVLTQKTARAAREFHAHSIWLVGGVAANRRLRDVMQQAADAVGVPLLTPPPALCTDNGAMIAAVGGLQWLAGVATGRWEELHAQSNLMLEPWKRK